MKLTVSVTQKHIDEGSVAECRECPIALALNEQHPRPNGWTVGTTTAGEFARDSARWEIEYLLPEEARAFIDRFDENGRVAPFTFAMEPVGQR